MKDHFPSFISPTFSSQWAHNEETEPTEDLSLIQVDTEDSVTKLARVLGEDCLQVNNPKGAPWLYMRLPSSAGGIGRSANIEVTLLANFESTVWIEYDSLDQNVTTVPDAPGAFKRSRKFSLSPSNQFQKISFILPDCKFSHRINGADFRIVAARAPGDPIFISKVVVKQSFGSEQQNSLSATDYYSQYAKTLSFKNYKEPVCSIIIPVLNRYEYTLQCLKYLKETTHCPYEIIIVDDGSNQHNINILKQVKGIQFIQNEKNLGFAKTCNRGASVAKAPYLLFLNNDTIPKSNWLEALLETIQQEDSTGIVGSKLIFPGTTSVQHAGLAFDQHGLPYHLDLKNYSEDKSVTHSRYVNAVTGACFLTRKSLFQKLNGFDEAYQNGFEDIDYCLRVAELGYLTKYCAKSELYHYESITEGRINYLQEVRNRNFFQDRWLSFKDIPTSTNENSTSKNASLAQKVAKVIAFYLPQFHPIPENDKWWGKGFTEWTNAKKAQPLFEDHDQPREPSDLGYYNLTDPQARQRQADLAQEYGVHGFCYYYYWFDGYKLLEQPIEAVLKSGEPELPFCICWANENWSRRWDGSENEILMEQNHCKESDLAFIEEVLPILADPRYIRVDGKPLLLIYRCELFKDIQATSDRWRQACSKAGLGDIILASCSSFGNHSLPPGFDVVVEFPPADTHTPPIDRHLKTNIDNFQGKVYDYYQYLIKRLEDKPPAHPRFRTAMLGWDNTARRGANAHIFHGFSTQNYEYWLSHLLKNAADNSGPHEPFVFVNAWNEWAEGTYLEPDQKYQRKNLEATKRALQLASSHKDLVEQYNTPLKNILWDNLNKQLNLLSGSRTSPSLLRHKIENHLISPYQEVGSKGVAIVIHVFYIDIFEEILEYLDHIKCVPFTLYITTQENLKQQVNDLLTTKKNNLYNIYSYENRGRDILPFMKVLPDLIKNEHTYLVKVHTKKSPHRVDGKSWRKELFTGLLSNPTLNNGILQLINFPNIGILGPNEHCLNMKTYISLNLDNINRIANKLSITESEFMKSNFIAGTMFMARVDALKPLLKVGIKDSDFEDEKGQVDGTFAHALERAFAISAMSLNLEVTSFNRHTNKEYAYAEATN